MNDLPAPITHDSPRYAYWQKRILLSTIIGYALFYFVRKNLSVAMPVIEKDLGIGKDQLGLFLTAHGLLYGVSRFANGVLADRVNARWFMAAGLAICAGFNIAFGLSSAALAMGLFWAANGWFQGMGFPPCTRLMTHWFPPARLASVMSVWNISHSMGAGIVFLLCGVLVDPEWLRWLFGSNAPTDDRWRLCFFVPAGLALAGSVGLAISLRDTPESLGLPPAPGTEDSSHEHDEPLRATLARLVFSNRYIWILSLANFFVYIVRYGMLDWGPSFLKEARGVDLKEASWTVAAFEGFGILGMVSGGWITDRVFGGRGARACLFYMIGCTATLIVFWFFPSSSRLVNAAVLCTAGFFIYGPQCLIGICAANLATKRAAAAAAGLTGLCGYLSTAVSGYGVGWLAKHYGWDAPFMLFGASALIGALLFLACWPAEASGYDL
jgi:OPA family glycerol-3-phosphate transporter-like MFS transporter/OPA family sugar phosphate sensor protein UhpC-like MFS transporter